MSDSQYQRARRLSAWRGTRRLLSRCGIDHYSDSMHAREHKRSRKNWLWLVFIMSPLLCVWKCFLLNPTSAFLLTEDSFFFLFFLFVLSLAPPFNVSRIKSQFGSFATLDSISFKLSPHERGSQLLHPGRHPHSSPRPSLWRSLCLWHKQERCRSAFSGSGDCHHTNPCKRSNIPPVRWPYLYCRPGVLLIAVEF